VKRSGVVLAVAVQYVLSACMGPVQAEPGSPTAEATRAQMNLRAEAAAVPQLVRLVDDRHLQPLEMDNSAQETLRDILALITPEGNQIRYRFWEIGVPVAQALSLSRDRQLQNRLLENARFNSGRRARSESLLVLSAQKNPTHFKYFKEALLDKDVGIQFAAVESLEFWNLPEAVPLLLNVSERDWSPLIRAFSAQAVLRMGDPRGRDQLLKYIKSNDWLMRAMSARYLGELGKPEDADLLISRIAGEQDNPYVVAELCIAGLKLLARRAPVVARPPPTPRPNASKPRAQVARPFMMEPLVLAAPRIKISGIQLVPPQIDTELINLLEHLADDPLPVQVIDDNLNQLNRLITPQGFGLKLRYYDLHALLAEGLAGTTNQTLIQRMETIARTGRNKSARATTLAVLGQDSTRVDLSLFEYALRDDSIQVRFGAVEGLIAQTNPMVRGILAGAAQTDVSPVVRLFAAQALGRRGDAQGVDLVRRYLNDPDWAIRAMATYYLGQLGDDADFERILINLDRETNDYVISEDCLAVLRMSL
jgi:HEAT repeat protein